jgi:lipopolysaccharide/colanic/teichoic acid biosynthesis glycosyltransferase
MRRVDDTYRSRTEDSMEAWTISRIAEAAVGFLDDVDPTRGISVIAGPPHRSHVNDGATMRSANDTRGSRETAKGTPTVGGITQGRGVKSAIRTGDTARRIRDVSIAILLLVLTAPVMMLVAVLIKLDSPGPTLYRQERVGLRGRVFTLLKFRSMRNDAEVSGPRWAAVGDSRVTRVGKFIRLTRIDELPQLINVLRNEMSLIGPRPERPHFVRQLAELLPFYNDRAEVLPGISGYAQVSMPYGASVEDAREKLRYDLHYVEHRGHLLDLWILTATVRVVLFGIGAR